MTPSRHNLTRRPPMQQTLILLKPDAVQRRLVGEITARLERKGLRLAALKLVKAGRDLAEKHYAVHKGKPFYESLLSFLTSGPTVAMVWEGRGAAEPEGADRRGEGPARDDPRRPRAERPEQPRAWKRQPGERRRRDRPVVQAGGTRRLHGHRHELGRVSGPKIPDDQREPVHR